MEINLDTNINNYLYINYMLENEKGNDNDKSKSHLEREQTAQRRK